MRRPANSGWSERCFIIIECFINDYTALCSTEITKKMRQVIFYLRLSLKDCFSQLWRKCREPEGFRLNSSKRLEVDKSNAQVSVSIILKKKWIFSVVLGHIWKRGRYSMERGRKSSTKVKMLLNRLKSLPCARRLSSGSEYEILTDRSVCRNFYKNFSNFLYFPLQ